MTLGQRFFQWLRTIWGYAAKVWPLSFILDLAEVLQGFFQGKPQDATKVIIDTLALVPTPPTLLVAAVLASLSGKPVPDVLGEIQKEGSVMLSDPTAYLARKVGEIQASGEIQDAAAQLSALMQSLVWQPLQDLASQTEENPLKVAAISQASVQAVALAVHTLGVAAEILGVGQIETVATALDKMLDFAGLQEAGLAAIKPLFTAGIEPAAERFYNQFYRPSRIAIEQLYVLEALGLVPTSYVNEEAAKEGFRDLDIDLMRQVMYDRIGPSDILAARDIGMIDDSETVDRLMKKRFHPEDAQFMLTLSALQRTQSWGERIFQLALRNYARYQLSDDGLAKIARAVGFPQERIDFELNAARLDRESQATDLSVGQIESAFKANIIGDVEAATYLTKLQIQADGIPILLDTWKEAKTPGAQHLSFSTLEQAYHDGIITASQLLQKLEALNWKPEDARLLVDIAEWRAPTRPRQLSEGNILTAFSHKVITRDEALSLLQELGFIEADAILLLRAETLIPTSKQKELTTAEIAKLVELEVLSKENAIKRFQLMGYSTDDAELLLIALTSKVPSKPKQSTPKPKPAVKTTKVSGP